MPTVLFPPYPPPPLQPTTSPKRVVILGAGMAGLAAAQHLEAGGHRVVIVEARDRVGGRVCTLRGGFDGGQHVEAGAAYLPGNHTWTIGYARALGLDLVQVGHATGTALVHLRGKSIASTDQPSSWPVELTSWERSRAPAEWMDHYLREPLRAVEAARFGIRDPGWSQTEVADLDGVTLAALLRGRGASPGAMRILRLGYADIWGDGVDTFSALLFLRDAVMQRAAAPLSEAASGRPGAAPDGTAPGAGAAGPAAEPATEPMGSTPPPPSGLAPDALTTLAAFWALGTPFHPAVPVAPPTARTVPGKPADAADTVPPTSSAASSGEGDVKSHPLDPDVTFAVRGGNTLLAEALARELAGKIDLRLGTRVARLMRKSATVTVQCDGPDGELLLEADRVLCTLPFSALRHIDVTPSFAAAKRRAVDGLRYTSVTRVFAEFAEDFPSSGGWSGSAATDLPGAPLGSADWPGMWTTQPPYLLADPSPKTRIIEAWFSGEWARRLGEMAEEQRLSFVMEQLERVFPGAKAAHTGRGMSKAWDDDPWAAGAYAWFGPGQMREMGPHTAPPDGRVHFAGDHTSVLPGWIQGALESGIRAATEIHEAP